MFAPFATVGDLEARWRPLDEAEEARASVLIDDAADLLISLRPSLEDDIANGVVSLASAAIVVCNMVKRSMQAGEDGREGVTQQQQGAGPFSLSMSFANPTGDLYLTKPEKKRLKIGTQQAFVVDLISDEA